METAHSKKPLSISILDRYPFACYRNYQSVRCNAYSSIGKEIIFYRNNYVIFSFRKLLTPPIQFALLFSKSYSIYQIVSTETSSFAEAHTYIFMRILLPLTVELISRNCKNGFCTLCAPNSASFTHVI